MSLTPREEKVMNSILQWESSYFEYEPTDFEATYERWVKQQLNQLNPALIEKMNNGIDAALFHVHALIQNSRHQKDVRERLLSEARIFYPEAEEIEDLKACSIDQLTYIAQQQIARSRMLSLAQGGLSGTGGLLLLGIDIPAMIALQVRSIQYIAMNYGYDIQKPSEMMMSLKVFHASTLPKRYQHESWGELMEEISSGEADSFFYVGDESVADVSWLSMPLRQGMKGLIITMLKKKVVQGIPLIGVLFGAGMNYQKSREVTEFAHKFYQKRFLMDKQH
ncbi:EcsC family protein [Fictibacillus fluitans]|uniref:EcsC family protein n=1 Tax=Fictibacillus fluitans TaxID=3058422 RepID=A0ABT8I4P7_9BACL|nr:EcsC family protein [Fictibacillus sp. NE201]MDN4527522.1 EcsC family protein [Fictibacillus sp. NE201]